MSRLSGWLHRKTLLLIVGVMIGSLITGAAVAKVFLPQHSVGWNKLTLGVQERIESKGLGSPALEGPQGTPGPPGPEGPSGSEVVLEPRSFGFLSPSADEPLARSENAKLVMLEDTPGIWCIEPQGVDTNNMVVLVSPAEESHVSTEEPQIPVVQWHKDRSICGPKEAEIETSIYDIESKMLERSASVPFSFLIEEVEEHE
jgi:hypothetical protein